MAATTKLLQLRPRTLSAAAPTSVHLFSSSTTPDPDNTPSTRPQPQNTPPPSHSQSPFSSLFSDLKARLKQPQQPQERNPPQSQPPRTPFSFSSSISNRPNPSSNIASEQEIRGSLSEFHSRSVGPPPPPPLSSSSGSNQPPHSPQHVSLEELYHRNLVFKGKETVPYASNSARRLPYEAIRESLRHLQSSSSKTQSQGGGRVNNPMSISRVKEGLLRLLDPSAESSRQRVVGGSDHLPLSIFGPEIKKEEEGDSNGDAKMRTEFVRAYSPTELGKKLRALRPENRDKKDWFSLEELSERLVKLREMEEKESEWKLLGIPFKPLRDGLEVLNSTNHENKKRLSKFGKC